jgi:hypothetical protein
MGLFLWLLVLLAVAWGLAEYQLNSRIEVPPPPTVSKPLPAKPAPPVADAPTIDASNNPSAEDTPVPADPAKD